MTTTQQSEAIRLADWLDDQYDPTFNLSCSSTELRHLHARVLELEEMLRKEVQHSSELSKQLEAIGAGGVESLRKKGA